MINFFKPFKLIFCFFFVLGLVFFTRSITSFASSASYSGQVTRVFYSSSYSGSPSDGHTYKCRVNNSTWSMSFVGHTGESYSNLTGEVYLLTTSGTYLVGVAGGSNSSITVANANSSRYYDGYPLKLFGILRGFVTSSSQPGSHSSGTLSLSASVEDSTGTNVDLSSIKSDTSEILRLVQGLDFSSLYDLVADIWVYLDGNQRSQFANVLSTLIDCDVVLDSIDDSLTEMLISVQEIKRSLCFDFPLSIDANYQLAMAFHSVTSANNNPLSLGYCAFDVNPSTVIFRIFIRVPSSKKIGLFFTPFEAASSFTVPTFYNKNYGTLSPTVSSFSSFSNFRVSYIDFSNTNVDVGDFIYFDMPRVYSSFRFAIYDYVVSASDILDYMNNQWSGASVEVDPFINEIDTASGVQDSIHIMESGSWSDLNDNYTYTGLGSFSFNAFTGMKALTTIINRFYLKLPSQYALYIVGVMFIGIAAVLISAVGRVIQKGKKG